MKLFTRALLIGALSVALQATAAQLGYEIGSGSSVAANTGNGLIIDTALASGLAGRTFTLDDGDSTSFAFFNIWTQEGDVGNDDISPKQITATLDFAIPDVDAVVGGGTVGRVEIVGWLLFVPVVAQYGQVNWSEPAIINAGDRQFEVALSNEVFNWGLYGLTEGQCFGATVEATVTQLSSQSAQVPDGGVTLMLLGAAMVGLGWIRKKA